MPLTLAKHIEVALRQALPDRQQYFLHEPQFEGNEWKYVKSCIDDGWVSSAGAFVDRFEADLARYTGVKHAVVCVNGTAALHIALKLVGVERGDEVLTPALTFVATANAISYCDAAPVFVDSSLDDFGVDALRLGDFLAAETTLKDGVCINNTTGKVIRAIVPVHVFGHPCRMDKLKTVCDEYHIA
jgi:perosamine synthetase